MRDLYIIQSGVTGCIKVGRTSDIETRIQSLQTGCPHPLRLLLLIPNQGHLEKSIHKLLRNYNTSGEWFDHQGLVELPSWIYEQINLDEADQWWRNIVEWNPVHTKVQSQKPENPSDS